MPRDRNAYAIAPPSCCRRGVLIAAQSIRTREVFEGASIAAVGAATRAGRADQHLRKPADR
jgi:hypothetical protein